MLSKRDLQKLTFSESKKFYQVKNLDILEFRFIEINGNDFGDNNWIDATNGVTGQPIRIDISYGLEQEENLFLHKEDAEQFVELKKFELKYPRQEIFETKFFSDNVDQMPLQSFYALIQKQLDLIKTTAKGKVLEDSFVISFDGIYEETGIDKYIQYKRLENDKEYRDRLKKEEQEVRKKKEEKLHVKRKESIYQRNKKD